MARRGLERWGRPTGEEMKPRSKRRIGGDEEMNEIREGKEGARGVQGFSKKMGKHPTTKGMIW